MNWYLKVLQNYIGFEGRASRSEYWFFTLFNILIILGLYVLFFIIHILFVLIPVYDLAVLLPSIAVCFRRLHDVGKSAWFLLLLFVPIIGWLVLLYFYVQPSEAGQNKYGAKP